MSEFKPLRTASLKETIASVSASIGKSISVFRTKSGEKLYAAPEGDPTVCLFMFSEKIQSKSDITADTVVGTFLNTAGEEVMTAYNPGTGKEAEFSL